MKTIKELFGGMDYKLINLKPDTGVRGISADSRTIKPGEIFIAVDGPEHNGYDYIDDALKKGARAICVDKPHAVDKSLRIILVRDTAKAISILASGVYNEPSRYVRVIGVTGTNGKTTITYLMYEILKAAKKKPSLIGTVVYKINDKTVMSSNTTPGPLLLHSLLAGMRDAGSDYAVMEVSSHALKQARVFGIDFKTAILTNITGDHLDYHKTMNDYAKSKRILFESLKADNFAVLNKDDSFYEYFKKATRAKVMDYGIENRADFTAKNIKSDINGSLFLMETPIGPVKIKTPLIGRHNIYNVLAAACASFAEGVSLDTIIGALGESILVPGRLEAVNAGQSFRIFVDYAHTHDALEKVLSELRLLCKGKLTVVIGCGGNRDKTKRPKMGRIASEIADEVIITNDNPRDEDSEIILNEIEGGIKKDFKRYKRIPDRFEAIKESLKGRNKNDAVIIAGKGHEDYQIIGKKTFPFSDREAIEKILKQGR